MTAPTTGTVRAPTAGGASRAWRRRVPAPTRRLAGALTAVAVVALVAPTVAAVLLAALGVVVIVDVVRSVDPSRVPVERSLPAVVPLDGDGELTWHVANPGGRRLEVALADELAPSLGASRRRVAVVVPPFGRVTAGAVLSPSRRGLFTPTQLTVRVTAPWGLASRQHTRLLPGRVEVHPSFRSRREAELRLTRGRLLEVGLRSARGRGGGTDFEALREYVRGDEVRRVDWAATARAGKPIVRTFRAERNQTVLALLDSGRVMAGTVDDVPRLDHAMDALMALTTVTTRMGDRLGMLSFGSRVHGLVSPRGARDQLRRVTSSIYALEPELAESDYRGAFTHALATFRRRALLVLLTELADEAVTETLLPALPLVLREHALVVASVRDPAVERWEHTPAETAGDAYRSAAAAAAARRRRQTVRYLQGLGVTVVDEPPERLAGALVDAYLDLKARGRV